MSKISILHLNTLMKSRQARNPRYSLGALARDLEISQSHLSRILLNQRRITPATALKLVLQLNLEREELLNLLIDAIENQ